MKSDLAITQELRDKLRERYGSVVDHIEMRRFENSDYEVSIIFRNTFRRNQIPNSITDQLIVENSMHKLCDAIDKMVFDRKPNMPISNIGVRVSDRIPEGMIFISPKTYQETIYSKQRQ